VICVPVFVVVKSDTQRRVALVIREAATRAYGTIGAACVDMEIKNQSHFGEALDGERGLPAGFLSLSPKFWGWLAVGLATEFGVPRELKSAFRLMLGVVGRRRIVKARMHEQKEVA
jgi:hypothetical protein